MHIRRLPPPVTPEVTMDRPPGHLAAIALVLPVLLSAQAPAPGDSLRLRECRTPEEPLGIFTANGRAAFRVGPDGRPDTSSVRVLDVTIVSPAAYRSATTRLLSACRFRMPGRSDTLAVELALDFEGLPLPPVGAIVLAHLPAGLAIAPVLVPTEGLPLADDDARLEEYPLLDQRCRGVGPVSPPSGMYTSLTALMAAFDEWGRRNAGRLTVVLEIARDGSVVPGSVAIEDAEDPRAAARLAERLGRCRFAPARIGGVPVPAMTRFKIRGAGRPRP